MCYKIMSLTAVLFLMSISIVIAQPGDPGDPGDPVPISGTEILLFTGAFFGGGKLWMLGKKRKDEAGN